MRLRQPRVLVLRALGLGDLLAGVPALRAIRRGFPGHQVVLAAPGQFAPLVELAEVADRLLATEELAPVEWAGPPPELAVDLHGNGPASHDLLRVLQPGRLLCFSRDGDAGAAPWWPRWRGYEPERGRWCRLAAEGLGVPADPADLALRRPLLASPRPGAVVVHPGAAYPSRRWPADRYGAVAAELVAAGADVVVTGSASEGSLAERVRREAGLPSGAVLAGRTGVAELAALVADAPLVVSADTGIAHLATAFGTPSVTVFGPTPPSLWGPPDTPRHTVLWAGTGTADPWADRPDPALLRIGTADVTDACARHLESSAARPAR